MTSSVEQPKLNKNGDRRGMHPNSKANLQPPRWKPGESGNPSGLSLKRYVNDVLREPLKNIDPKTAKAIQLLALAIVRDAIKGSKEDRKEIWERLEGKVTQPIGGQDGKPIQIEFDAKSKLLSLINNLATRSGEAEDYKYPVSEGS